MMKATNSSQDIDGFINVSEKVTCPKAVESTYDTWAESYEEDTSDQLGFTSPMECAAAVASVSKDGDSFLDVGCGTGLVAKCIKETHGRVFGRAVGADLSLKMLEHAKDKGLYNAVTKLDMSVLPWPGIPSEAFDVVACNGVLIYVDEVDCLDEFIRVTRPGGHICLMFRHDGLTTYQAKVESLVASSKWEVAHKSESMRNFSATESGAAADVMYNIWTFRKC